jgi:electron transfer flavoprotein alpha subunit
MSTTTLVLVEIVEGQVSEVSLEAVTTARELGGSVHVAVVGTLPEVAGKTLGEYGVERVLVLQWPSASSYAAAAWAAGVVSAADAVGAETVVASGTLRGNEVLAHVACRQGTAMAANVVTVVSADPLVVSRQVMGGTALEEMRLEGRAVFSVAGHACEAEPAAAPGAAAVETLEVDVPAADLVAQVTRTEPAATDESKALKSAKVVVGAGRGAGGPDGFGDVLELVDLVGGSLGVSRVVTSLGWRPHHEQVGQTGSRINPDLYVACGISGAIQHWAGCASARTILAINTDPDAPMVTKAHYAVIGDMHEVVPAINAEIRRRKG